jgi:hypothetical protein
MIERAKRRLDVEDGTAQASDSRSRVGAGIGAYHCAPNTMMSLPLGSFVLPAFCLCRFCKYQMYYVMHSKKIDKIILRKITNLSTIAWPQFPYTPVICNHVLGEITVLVFFIHYGTPTANEKKGL